MREEKKTRMKDKKGRNTKGIKNLWKSFYAGEDISDSQASQMLPPNQAGFQQSSESDEE